MTDEKDEQIKEVLLMLKGLLPRTKSCPQRPELRVTWFPQYSREGITVESKSPISGFGGADSKSHKANIFYQCDYSGCLSCNECMRLFTYRTFG